MPARRRRGRAAGGDGVRRREVRSIGPSRAMCRRVTRTSARPTDRSRRGSRPGRRPRPSIGRGRRPRRPRRQRSSCRHGRGTARARQPCTVRSPSSGRPGRRWPRVGRTGTRAWSASLHAANVSPVWGTRIARRPSGDRGPRRTHRSTIAAGRRGSGRVSASRVTTQSVVAASSPCCSAQALPAHPAGSGPPATTRAPSCSASAAVPSLDPSSTTITSSTRGAPTIASSNGPIRVTSSRAGTTTEIDGNPLSDREGRASVPGTDARPSSLGAMGGAVFAARARRARAITPAATREPSTASRRARRI